MRMILSIAVIFMFASVLSGGCSKLDSSPKGVLSRFLDASLHGRYVEAYQYISAKDRAVKSPEEFSEENKDNPLGEALMGKIKYKIHHVVIMGDSALVRVNITEPDFSILLRDLFGAAFLPALGEEKDKKELERIIAEKYKHKDIPTITREESFTLVKEAEGWKVFFDWETRQKISSALEAAERMEKKKHFQAGGRNTGRIRP